MPDLSPFAARLPPLTSPFQQLLGAYADAATLYTLEGVIVALNESASRLRRTVAFADLQDGTLAREAFAEAAAGRVAAYEAHVRSDEGAMRLRVDLTPVLIEATPAGVLEIAREPRPAIAPEEEDEQLTGLPSAAVLHDRISRLLLQMRRDGRPFALHLFSVALERPESEAMTLELRRTAARRLLATLRQVDTVARLGRAFVVVQPDAVDATATGRLVERLVDELREPLAWSGKLHAPIVRVGSALADRRTASVDELFVEADLRLVRARGGRVADGRPLGG